MGPPETSLAFAQRILAAVEAPRCHRDVEGKRWCREALGHEGRCSIKHPDDSWVYLGQDALRHALRAVGEVAAERDELALTLLNERGEGAGPSPRWVWSQARFGWVGGAYLVFRDGSGLGWLGNWDGDLANEGKTARELMRRLDYDEGRDGR